jgi:type IV fimbrial biogenesis protein FimT
MGRAQSEQLLGSRESRCMLKPAKGFSLIELIVAMAIFGVLMALAAPSFSGWIRNMKIRTAAESIQTGLHLARSEALRRNAVVRFQFTDTMDGACALSTNGPHWFISLDNVTGDCDVAASEADTPRTIQSRNSAEGGGNVTALASGQNLYTFNGLGRLTSTPSDILVTSSEAGHTCITAGGSVRCLRIVVSAGGQIRMCDPALPSTDAQAC